MDKVRGRNWICICGDMIMWLDVIRPRFRRDFSFVLFGFKAYLPHVCFNRPIVLTKSTYYWSLYYSEWRYFLAVASWLSFGALSFLIHFYFIHRAQNIIMADLYDDWAKKWILEIFNFQKRTSGACKSWLFYPIISLAF